MNLRPAPTVSRLKNEYPVGAKNFSHKPKLRIERNYDTKTEEQSVTLYFNQNNSNVKHAYKFSLEDWVTLVYGILEDDNLVQGVEQYDTSANYHIHRRKNMLDDYIPLNGWLYIDRNPLAEFQIQDKHGNPVVFDRQQAFGIYSIGPRSKRYRIKLFRPSKNAQEYNLFICYDPDFYKKSEVDDVD